MTDGPHPTKERYTMSLKRLLISIAAAALLALGVAACGGGDTKTVTVTGHRRRHRAGGGSGKTVKIIASVPPTDHGWLGAISKNAKAAAAQHEDVKFELLQAADADSQAQQIEQAIAKKPDALVVLPQDGAALTPVAQKAERPASRSSTSTALFTSPDARPRRSSATTTRSACSRPNYIADQLKCKGNVVEIQGLAGISVTDRPQQGLRRRAQEEVPGRRHQDRRQPAGRLQPRQGPEGDGEHPPGAEEDRRRLHARRRHGPGRRPGDPQRRPRERDVPDRRRRLRGRDEADQGGRPVPRDVPLQPEHGRRPPSTWRA